ncbi:MAG: hypothetical protein HN704_05060 [Bacteroidetes bacterium]|jgi:hypothetical protein|nr:hypothetical protein [Bacteroidota bacterium]MBT6685896.1 hypothetical protein [Bacteroidota bacterium]MBT7144040.1 hypothetical protein [Bacteroidota bacterium]MBT7490962.1 hypothetical protein [Bacteroidota bacterium]
MNTQHIIVHPANQQEISVLQAFFKALKIKFEFAQESPYDPKFVAKIEESRKQVAEGKTEKIDLDDIWK